MVVKATTEKTTAKKNDLPTKASFWVGIGASAGGLEALRGFVRNLPDDLSATYIVAQHMAPHHKSMLSDIIGRETSMRVLDVTDNLLPEPNTIYITPPNTNIVVKRNRLRLIDPSKAVAAPKPSIDVFFESLATAKKTTAIGIIFSGTGSDGALGVTAIREHGGITIAQDELSAKYTSMPITAIDTGAIDLIMAPEELGAQFSNIISKPRALEALNSSPTNHDAIGELVQLLLSQTKVNFAQYKTPTFQRRLERRMAAVSAATPGDYVNIARESPEEIGKLYSDLLISVTSFFRDPAEFKAVDQHIERIVADKNGDPIRIWVPGVATGEEAYSIAILFCEAARKRNISLEGKIQIFATDLDLNAIETARRGYYPETDLAELSGDIIERYFDPGPKGFVVKKAIRQKMVFSIHNVAQDPPFLNIDMISCRNLLIYFQASLQAEVFSRFHYSLVPNGLLFVGKSEAITASDALFRPAHDEKHIFFQRPTHAKRPPRDMLYERPLGGPRLTAGAMPPQQKLLENALARFESLMQAIGPNGLLINSDLQIMKSYGDVSKYVSINAGTVSTTAASLLKTPYRQDVQFSVPAVIRNHKASIGVVRSSNDDPRIKERVSIYPLGNGSEEEIMALVIFNEWEDDRPPLDKSSATSEETRIHVEELTNELAMTKVNLQQTVEELETSNEELQALNEELQSSNEELQSTNEELETSNEELQSTNEELSTVNEELQVNSQQLNIVNHNLSSILQNISMPLIVVDRSLYITHVSHVAEQFFNIAPDLALPHISRCRLPKGFPDLTQYLNEAMGDGVNIKTDIEYENGAALLSVVPHFSSTDELMGAIVIVSENTQMLKKARDELQIIFDHVPSALMVRDKNGEILKANKSAQKLAEKYATRASGKNFYEYFSDEEAKKLKISDRSVLESGEPLLNFETSVRSADGEEFHVRMNKIPGAHPDLDEPVIYALTENITAQFEAAQRLENSERRLGQALDASKMGIWEWDVKTDKVYWSKGVRDFVGVLGPIDNLTVNDINTRIHPDDIEMVQAKRKAHFEHGAPYHFEFRLRHESGKYVYVETNAVAERNEDGEVFRFTGTLEDVTKKRANYIELKARQAQMDLAAQLSGVGYWQISHGSESVFWSGQVYTIHGVSKEEYTPELKSALSFYHPDDVKMVQETLESALAKAEPFQFEARLVRKDGAIRNVHSIGSPNVDKGGNVIGVFGVFEDITEDKMREEELRSTLEELSRSNEELNRFSYICSHDMKEPVRMIEAMSALLVDPSFETSEDKKMELLQRISKNTIRLRSIIESLLAYSRIDAKVDASTVDLNSVLSGIHDSLALIIEERDADFQIDELPEVWGAKVHFMQLFQNLIGNALKFNLEDSPKVRISASKRDKGWVFFVDDNGPGIPEESRDTIFELFGRLQRQDEVEGSGLGLSIAEKIVHQYDGTISCSSSPLGGARFEIFIPERR